MFIAACRFELHLASAQSLKDKRAVVQSVITRLHNQFHISAAEIDELDRHQIAAIGLAVVSNQAQHARQVIERALRSIEESRLDAELVAIEIEEIPAF
ncbi:MAG: DUF503 domain-containing protein [Chloroflexi bacterium]|nr:DUF503 domain-containing protein [Chloroflexota bacterium]